MAEFKANGVVPDVIPNPPPNVIKVTYKSGVSANLGNELTPTQVKDEPHVEYKADANALYTVILTDPDAPSRKDPKFRQWVHWVVVNVPGSDISKGELVIGYVGSGPPKGSGLHRYVFLVYKQGEKIDASKLKHISNRSGDGRGKWNAETFVKGFKGFELEGGNFYQAQWDDYVPKLYEQLKG